MYLRSARQSCLALLLVVSLAGAQQANKLCYPVAGVRTVDGRATMYFNGSPVMPMSFCSRNNQDNGYLQGLLKAGIKVHFPICDTEWKNPRGFERLEELAHRILSLDPEAILILRLSLDPPESWLRAHPEECIRFENGEVKMIIDQKIGRTYDPKLTDALKFSLASEAWKEQATQALEDFFVKVGNSDFAHRVAGYFFTASETEEWYYTVTYDRRYHCHDFSEPFLRYFKSWLRRKYGTDRALAEAWNNDVKGFDSVRIPQLAERRLYTGVGELPLARYESRSDFGTLADPDHSVFESDYYRALNESVADAVVSFCGKVKELSGGTLLTGAFYGYLTCCLYHEFGTCAAAQKVQDSGVVDFCASPSTYFNRHPGGQSSARSPFSSYMLRNMFWFNEEDTRTNLCDFGNWVHWSQTYSAQESCDLIKRDFAKTLTGHYWAWWFENSRRDRWYDDPQILSTFKRIQEVFEYSRKFGRNRAAEIAFLASEPSIYYMDQESLRDLLMWQRQLEFERIGAPYDYYYVRDLAHPQMPDYKLYVFLNAVSLDDRERAMISEKIAAKGGSALWLYAAGLINPDRRPKLDLAYMEELTGFDFDYKQGRHYPQIVIENPRHPMVAGLPRDRYFGSPDRPILGSFETRSVGQIFKLEPSVTDPLFFIADTSQVAGGIFSENGLGAIGETRRAGYHSMYIGAKYVQASLIRAAAARAGVHIYSNGDDVLHSDGDFLVIHARTDGEKTLSFPEAVNPYEVFEKKLYGERIRQLRFQMKFGQTKVFCLKGRI